jgi:hypothetical protein
MFREERAYAEQQRVLEMYVGDVEAMMCINATPEPKNENLKKE